MGNKTRILFFYYLSVFSLTNFILDINECSNNPCINGKCVDKINSYECECQPGYRGKKCEESKGKNLFLRSKTTNCVLKSVTWQRAVHNFKLFLSSNIYE